MYSRKHTEFSKHWNARLIIKDIERLNPDFYPKSILQVPSKTPGYRMDWLARKDDVLTKENFFEAYDKCGLILHAENPFGPKIDYPKWIADAINWRSRIVNLLNSHTIRLVDDTNVYLFQMGSTGENPSYIPFGLVE